MTEIYSGRAIRLVVEEVKLPNGRTVELEVVHHPGAAAVVPVDAGGRVHLVRQYRHAAGGWLLEVPAGKLDRGESPEACAVREVEEEAGVRAGRLVSMGWIWTTPGFSNEKIWLFLAYDLVEVGSRPENDEILSVERVPLADAIEMAASGEIQDAKSICALLRAPRYTVRTP